MKQIKSFLILGLLILGLNSALHVAAQNVSIDQIANIKLRNSGPIIADHTIVGYYFFYIEDKVDRKTNAYQLRILDQNLKEVGRKQFTEGKYVYLAEASFNDKSILLKFYDAKEETVLFHRYGLDAKLIKREEIETEKYERQMYSAMLSKGEITGSSLYPIPGKGFVHYRMLKEKKYTSKVDFIPESGGKAWTYKAEDEGSVNIMTFLMADENFLLTSLTKKKNIFAKENDFYIIGTDPANGKKLFELPLNDGKHFILPNNAVSLESGEIKLFGIYYNADDNLTDQSQGFAMMKVSRSGDILEKKLISWKEDVGKMIDVDKKGRLEGIGYVFFHRIIRHSSGKVFIVGEQFKKSLDAGGIAVQALGGGTSAWKIQVMDLMIFEMNPAFELEQVHIFEKEPTNITLPQGAGLINGPHLLAYYVKYYGGFDYRFTQENEDRSIFTVGCMDYTKVKGEKNHWTFKAITYRDLDFATDAIPVKTEADAFRILPAKPGYIMMIEYYRKEKKLDLHLEQVNY